MHDDGFLLAGEDKERVIYTVACIGAISPFRVLVSGRSGYFLPPAQLDTLALTFQEWRNRRDKI